MAWRKRRLKWMSVQGERLPLFKKPFSSHNVFYVAMNETIRFVR